MRIAGPKVRLLLVAAQRAGPASFGHKNTDRSLFNSPPGLAQVSPPGRALCVHAPGVYKCTHSASRFAPGSPLRALALLASG